MKRPDWAFALRVLEIALGLCPAIIFVIAASIPYVFAVLALLLSFFYGPSDPDTSAAITSLLQISAMVFGGILGLVSIGLLSDVARFHNSRTRRVVAVVFGCAGLTAEMMFVAQGGMHTGKLDWLTVWILGGPVVVGIHFAYRAFRHNARQSQVS